MRVIAGEYRGRRLKTPPDNKIRPTSDRLRETLFNILNARISDETRFLDLCAGTGAIGIEAISRRAQFVTFLDKSRRSCALIEENLDALDIPEQQTEIICNSAENFVSRDHQKAWDVIFYDPPYKDDYAIVLHEVGDENSKVLSENGILIIEHHFKNILPDAVAKLRRWRIVKQGETCLSFYKSE